MRQLINALIKYKNTLLYLGLLFLSTIILSNRSFYHKSTFSKGALAISSNFNLMGMNITNYMDLVDQNKKLIAENEKLKALELMHQNNIEYENRVPEKFGYEVKSARIIKNSYQLARNYLIIDKGAKDGVALEMGVISSDGIIGIVNQVTDDFSSVLSILHRDLKINAGFKKNGAYGSLIWEGNHPKKMKLNDISSLNTVSTGDTIITAGMSDYFPYGIPIGVVTNIKKPELEGYLNIDVELFSNLTEKKFVYVIDNIKIDQLKALKYE